MQTVMMPQKRQQRAAAMLFNCISFAGLGVARERDARCLARIMLFDLRLGPLLTVGTVDVGFKFAEVLERRYQVGIFGGLLCLRRGPGTSCWR